MKMLKDHELYLQLCEKRGLKSPSEILNAIKNSSSTGELQLSCVSVLVSICEVVAQVLTSSSAIKSLDLSDCMLLSKGLGSILNALCEGSSITCLNLKGNNINGPMVAQLGQVFVHNNTLRLVNVEWNSVGAHVDSFTKFCDGLIKNHTIEELDLRYNQISPYCAEALSRVLKCNKSLKVLDLSWNTLGLQGGQLLQAGTQDNKTVTHMNLHGNCIPSDTLQSIDDLVRANQSRQAISATSMSKGIERAKSLLVEESKAVPPTDSDSTIQIRQKWRKRRKKRAKTCQREVCPDSRKSEAESEADLFLVQLLSAEEYSESARVQKDRTMMVGDADESGHKIKELNRILEDRTTAINLLTNEIAVKSAEIEAARSQGDQLRTEMEHLREEREKLGAEHAREIQELREKHRAAEKEWEKARAELEDSSRKGVVQRKELDLRMRRYERDIHRSSVETATLRDKLASVKQSYDDLVSKDKTEIHRLRRELKERECRHKNELIIVKNTLRDTTKALEDCQLQLQKSRGELREAAESQTALRERISDIEHANLRYTRSEESLHKVKEEKDSLEEKLTDSQRLTGNLQRQIVALQTELVEPQRRYELLNDELLREKEKTARLKEELGEERQRSKEQNVQIQKMALQITALNTQINDIQTSHTETLRERDKERKQLKDIIALKERDINEMKAEEIQRAGQLYAAFSKYLGSRGPNPVL